VVEGHLVPPPSQASSSGLDPSIRGYIRQNLDGTDFETMRAVGFDEVVDDPRVNLPGDFSILDEDNVEPQVAQTASSGSSEDGCYQEDSPTPATRASSRVSTDSMGSYDAYQEQFVAPSLLSRDAREHSPLQVHHSCQILVRSTRQKKSKELMLTSLQESQGSHSRLVPRPMEASGPTIPPNESFDNDLSMTERDTLFLELEPQIAREQMNRYAMAAFPSWPPPFMYHVGRQYYTHSPAHCSDHTDYFPVPLSMAATPMTIAPPSSSYVGVDQRVMTQGIGQSAPTLDDRKPVVMKAEPNMSYGVRAGDAGILGMAHEDVASKLVHSPTLLASTTTAATLGKEEEK
jgi:hypothetical protein